VIKKIFVITVLFTSAYSQVDISNQLSARYGDSDNDYNYNEIYLDTKLSLNRENYRLESILNFEVSDPPESGLNANGLDGYLFGFYNDKFSFEVGDIHQTWGRGLLLNQLDFQNLDFDTGSRGLGMQFNYEGKILNIIMGDTSSRKSTTVLGNYDPRVPNYFIDQFIYGADFSLDITKFNIGAAFLLVDEEERSLSHTLTNVRIDRSHQSGEFFMSVINKVSEKDSGNLRIYYPEKDGGGVYLSNTNYFKDWALTSSYRKFTIDVNNPVIRDNIVDNYGEALDLQQIGRAHV
jgi:hypothetical protein